MNFQQLAFNNQMKRIMADSVSGSAITGGRLKKVPKVKKATTKNKWQKFLSQVRKDLKGKGYNAGEITKIASKFYKKCPK